MPIQILKPAGLNVVSSFAIEEESYQIGFRFNPADSSWKVSILTSDSAPIISGMKCIPNQPLTDRYARSTYALPSGDLWCVDTEGSSDYVIWDQFGTDMRYQLWYLTEKEIEEYGLDRLR